MQWKRMKASNPCHTEYSLFEFSHGSILFLLRERFFPIPSRIPVDSIPLHLQTCSSVAILTWRSIHFRELSPGTPDDLFQAQRKFVASNPKSALRNLPSETPYESPQRRIAATLQKPAAVETWYNQSRRPAPSSPNVGTPFLLILLQLPMEIWCGHLGEPLWGFPETFCEYLLRVRWTTRQYVVNIHPSGYLPQCSWRTRCE